MVKTLTFAFIALAARIAADSIDNSKQETALTNAAVLLVEGDYTITNVGTGQTITYVESGQNWFPSSGGESTVTTFNQNPSGPYMRLNSNGGLQKCVSAQWGYDEAGEGIGADHAGVLYTCAVGSGADPHSTVEKTKQWWLFVPVAGNSTTNNLETDTLLSKDTSDDDSNDQPDAPCNKTKEWIRRHPLYVNGPRYHHTECAPYLTHSQAISLNVTVEAGWNSTSSSNSKRTILNRRNMHRRAAGNSNSGSDVNGGTFYIIALDHLHDMETRALSGKMTYIPGGSKGTVLDPYDETDPDQQWVVTAAN